MRLLHARHGDGHDRLAAAHTRILPTQDIARVMDRNVCRCGTYPRIVKAVQACRGADARDAKPGARDELRPAIFANVPELRRHADEVEVERYELTAPARIASRSSGAISSRIFAVMGGGLLVVAAAPAVAAQESGRGGQRRGATNELAAWLHIDENGRSRPTPARPRSGRTSGRRWRRRSPTNCACRSSAITMVMADTDLVPFDAGHVRIAVDAADGPQLARAAATAREMLIDRAAARWQVERGSADRAATAASIDAAAAASRTAS